jgi:hypothetical protein
MKVSHTGVSFFDWNCCPKSKDDLASMLHASILYSYFFHNPFTEITRIKIVNKCEE